MVPPIVISAEDVNCLIHSYLQDSGFKHSAFALRAEGRLEQSSRFSERIPRGELVELLSKALLYVEVETHWSSDGMMTSCKTPFSLLDPHVCSTIESNYPTTTPSSTVLARQAVLRTTESAAKRKAGTPSADDSRSEKRAKRDDNMDADAAVSTTAELKTLNNGKNSSSDSQPSDAALKIKAKQQPPKSGGGTLHPQAIRLMQGHKTEVFVCAWNPAIPELLATGSKDAIVNIWTLPAPNGVSTANSDLPLTIKDISTAKQADLTSLDWNCDGTLLAIGSYDSVLRICTKSGETYYTSTRHQGPIFATQFSKSGRWLLTASLDGTACVWDVKAKKLQMQYSCHRDCCLDVDWLDEKMFASCGADMMIHVMKLEDPSPIKSFWGHENEINQIKCNPSRTRLASCSDDQTARIWNVVNVSPDPIPGLIASEEVVVLKGHRHAVSSIGWCTYMAPGTNELVATSSFDGTARLWDSVTGECLKIFADHKRPVYALSFSPDGHWLATGSGDGWLHVYNVKAKEKKWSWYAGSGKPGVFEIDWQRSGTMNRIALALECRQVGVIDVTKIPELSDVP